MTKGELMAQLIGVPDTEELFISVPTNDFWNTVQILPLTRIGEITGKFDASTRSYIEKDDQDETTVELLTLTYLW